MNHGWRLGPSCHLVADDLRELHDFARRLGLKAAWFQRSRRGMPHYDLTAGRRLRAVRLGARELDAREFVALIRGLMMGRSYRLNVTHRADAPLTLNGCTEQRCAYCGELLWAAPFGGKAHPLGGVVTYTLRQDASAAVVDVRAFAGADDDPIHDFCYEGWQDKEGHVLLPKGAREQKCRTCAQGHLPALLDDDGVIFAVSGELGTWGHGNLDGWWPCRGVR